MTETNHELARIFNDLASIYRYLGTEECFRALAFSKAAQHIDNLKDDVTIYIKNETLEDIPGIGGGHNLAVALSCRDITSA